MVRMEETTDLEKYEMYMKSTKSELVKMLIQANKYLAAIGPVVNTPNVCSVYTPDINSTAMNCRSCNQPEWMHKME